MTFHNNRSNVDYKLQQKKILPHCRDDAVFRKADLYFDRKVIYAAFPLQCAARFKRAVPGPFLVAFPLGVVPASGYLFTVVWLSKIEVLSGPTTGLSMLN